jgi:hypothetical protein
MKWAEQADDRICGGDQSGHTAVVLPCTSTNTLRSAVGDQFRRGGRTLAQTKHQHLAMSRTATLQFSLAFVLLTSAGLPVRSLIKASETNQGFRPKHVVSLRISLPDTTTTNLLW